MPTVAQNFDLAYRHHQAGNLQQAEELYRQILSVDPQHVDAWHFFGLIALKAGRHDLACDFIRNALVLNPNYFEAHNNLGYCFWEQGKLEEAIACYFQALRLNPNLAGAHNNLGIAYRDQGRLDEAMASFQTAFRFKPDYFEAYNNLGLTRQDQGKLDEAEACFRQCLLIEPNYAEAHFNLGMLWLLMGKFGEGWLKYESRRYVTRFAFRSFPQPIWDGAPLNGKTILLFPEQGFGDTLQFIRYAPLVKQKGGRVVFECPAELVRIMRSCPGIDQILTQGSLLPPFHVQAPLLSLPTILKTSLATVPASVPYLTADSFLMEKWRQELSNYPGFKIGIVWQGNPRFAQPGCRASDRKRSIPLACFEPLARLPGVRLFSLQKGFGTEQLVEWKSRLGIIDLADKLQDFMDTAAVMMNLDLIISADTSPVHLAGALGRPVWAALPFTGCWRWLRDRQDSPWYPSLKLFRQSKQGDWSEVFERIAQEVRNLLV